MSLYSQLRYSISEHVVGGQEGKQMDGAMDAKIDIN